jgi:poly-beta-1,6-N-acetyl-D-glucosamine synthase
MGLRRAEADAGMTPGGRRGETRAEGGVPSVPLLRCSVGIMAYNEEGNIENAIRTILGQLPASGQVTELVVVASGCTDRTASIVSEIALTDPRIRLVLQERREGKASAVNRFIETGRCPVLLLVSADVVVKDGTIDALLRHFHDPTVGMVGGHPIPVNDERTFLGYAVHLLWRLHDRVARRSPKLGEIVAFRNVVPSIPLDSSVDEISLQAVITQLGYQIVYEPQAVIYNRGPTTVGDFLRQRRRIYAGHLRVRKQQHHTASTMSIARVGGALLGSGCFRTPRSSVWTLGTVCLEATARLLGHYDHVRRHPHHVWETALTTKRHIAEGADAPTRQTILVFYIIDFHRHQLELGMHASRQVHRGVVQHIQRTLGSNAALSVQPSSIIISQIAADPQEAEHTARRVILGLDQSNIVFNGHREGVSIQLACAIIALAHAGHTMESISFPQLVGPADSIELKGSRLQSVTSDTQ